MKTAEEKKKILGIIQKYNNGPSSLIKVLNMVQEEHNYLPKEVQELVAQELKLPLSRVVEVSSFYSRFTTEKMGKYAISVCMGTACYVVGAQRVLDEFKAQLKVKDHETTPDGLFTVVPVRCIGACGLAPVLTVNKDVHGKVTPDMVPGILAMYK